MYTVKLSIREGLGTQIFIDYDKTFLFRYVFFKENLRTQFLTNLTVMFSVNINNPDGFNYPKKGAASITVPPFTLIYSQNILAVKQYAKLHLK